MQPDRYAVFGNPIAHSLSPTLHAAFARQSGQNLSYEAILAPLDGFATSVRRFVAEGGRGANVTVPFKEEAFRLCEQLTPRAQAAGAVNTLGFENGIITGDNTDGVGLVRDIEHNLGYPLSQKRILLLGAGGAARGVLAPLLARNPARLVIANRTPEKAAQLLAAFAHGEGPSLQALAFAELDAPFDLVLNATSASLTQTTLPLSPQIFTPDTLAYDLMYGRPSPFLHQARQAGTRLCVDGLGMLVEQAAEAFFLWRGVRPSTGPVLEQLRADLHATAAAEKN